ncbi:sn-glycerol-3-phosphate ABC transporter ATP-binding protein UgpC [Massilia atriviolacea]|uniref:sn-glycerol-3-phosphate ABC transporter ATP-binding protein UgpC n=1 Tax=Massilia atriviolacea TaxID=2495579 RepID=A0A430HF10_9BURK|nr:sn-glycerol-3-phosphate ABC transporter ATP-binding protein UgpC [Massilia atriviolacea]RSZ56091.1 sn-glycerol-3-phosphate ABC transporter ATP-binding protein UgpC [Massilia atriviolacea]
MAAVTLKGVVKRYDDKQTIIHGIDLAIADGEFVVFVGPSGCGKSTLLRMIAGLEEISGGELHIGGLLANDVAPAKRGLAMVFQSYALYPHMTVFENMAFALKLAGHKGEELKAQVGRAAEILQIAHLLQRRPKELSGGQRQRVAIGRAIVRKPEVFLFDEPLSNLDASLRVQMRVELSRLHKELKTTMIYVTHDQVEAMTLGERIVVINGGRIEQVGTPYELYTNPGNLFVAGFLGAPKMNFIGADVAHIGAIGVRVRLADGTLIDADCDGGAAAIGDKVTLGIRAEHMALLAAGSAQANMVGAVVGHVEYLGDQTVVYASMQGDPALIALRQPQGGAALRAGERIAVHLPPAHCHLFDADGRAFARA